MEQICKCSHKKSNHDNNKDSKEHSGKCMGKFEVSSWDELVITACDCKYYENQ